MTIDEAIERAEKVVEKHEKLANTFKSLRDYGNPKSSITSGYEKCRKCAEDYRQLAEWLKDYKRLLEQESVLYKIRAEIEQITDTMGVSYNQYISKIDVLQIIDKYKSESEE